ncbi:hypothetical protein AVEN_178466-1 [Araneus ventricosus]|uniref:Uncharacterized protein n=1 Tax=Araneus ventricosus TaxID=182803 RepID=A0A4Y2CFL1_ARAVE|nr:hypothetical protein AVEN_178466-1 [Araneus ventricosus]
MFRTRVRSLFCNKVVWLVSLQEINVSCRRLVVKTRLRYMWVSCSKPNPLEIRLGGGGDELERPTVGVVWKLGVGDAGSGVLLVI